MGKKKSKDVVYLGVDLGGTKILASLVRESGIVLGRERRTTPRDGKTKSVLDAIKDAAASVLEQQGMSAGALAGVGVVVAGVVDPDAGVVIDTPNMSLSGLKMAAPLKKHFGVPVALGNDTNCATLGEAWLGSARGAAGAAGVYVGTGIGGGYVVNGELWRGSREAALEVGHIVAEIDGPVCGCGNKGCLEALASRTAMERQIRAAVKGGTKTALTDILGGDLAMIRSGAIRKAIDAGDKLMTKVLRRASNVIGHGLLTLRHVLDPEVIVIGGGVVEACGDFMYPIIHDILAADGLSGACGGSDVLISSLGDDAGILGAVALARQRAGRDPFEQDYYAPCKYPQVARLDDGRFTVGDVEFNKDVFVDVNGVAQKRKRSTAKSTHGDSTVIGPAELGRVCSGGPEVLIVGGKAETSDEGREYLRRRAIELRPASASKAPAVYNNTPERKAAVFIVAK